MTERRGRSFVWVTHLTKLLSGDDQCRYALWFKANHTYDKVVEDQESQDRLTRWKTDHAAGVEARRRALELDGYEVLTEAQTKFNVGTHATLAGAADLLGLHREKPEALVVDLKTGKRRDSDYWQVAIYMLYLPVALADVLKGRRLTGEVAYVDGGPPRLLDPSAASKEAADKVIALMQLTTKKTAPEATPSVSECKFCNIAECPYRKVGKENVAKVRGF